MAYRQAGYSKKFREEHEEEILLHQAAKNAFDEMGVKKLPKVCLLYTSLLNIDGKGPAHDEAVVAKSTRPSVLDHLKRPVPPRSTDKKPKQHEEVR